MFSRDPKIEPLELHRSKYQYGVYSKQGLIRLFRTDCADMSPVIRNEAEKFCFIAREEDPAGQYFVREIKYVKRVRPPGWGQT